MRLLEVDKHGNYVRENQFNSVLDYNFSSVAMRTRQKQILKISSEQIDLVPISQRDHSSMTIPVDEAIVPEVKERIKKFRRTLANYIVKNNSKVDQVYELQIGFFPLLKDE